jgi:repressor LexA
MVAVKDGRWPELKMQLGEVIKNLRVGRKMTQNQFSRTLGIAQGYLSDIEHGKKRPSDTLLIALSHLYEMPQEWLSESGYVSPELPGKKEIPLLRKLDGDPGRMGAPGEVVDYIRVPGVRGECYAVVAVGNFMAPTVYDGDIVIFCTNSELRNGDIAFLTNKWGDSILRRYRLKESEVFFAADNNAYAPFRPDSETRILGKVDAVWRNVRFNP